MNVPFRHHKKASSSLSRSAQDAFPQQPDLPPKISHTPGPGPNEYCPENTTMFQAFEWNCPKDQKHWTRLAAALPSLKSIGIDNMWIPPGCKGGWHGSNGYDIYDLYDLGEFQQKDSKGTKWGTKDELVEMMDVARKCGVGVYWDAVLNHKAAADFSEPCYAVKVDPKGTSITLLFQILKRCSFSISFYSFAHPARYLLTFTIFQTARKSSVSQRRLKPGLALILPAESVGTAL
jgi:Alpha amylase, catalytic domain